jgi:hypothetical protein
VHPYTDLVIGRLDAVLLDLLEARGWRAVPLFLLLVGAGCVSHPKCSVEDEIQRIGQSDIPRELSKMALPTYRVEPPDILLIETVTNIRQPDYELRAGDVITVRLANPEPLEPIEPDLNPLETQFRIQAAPAPLKCG